MRIQYLSVFLCNALFCTSNGQRSFPDDFLFGSASGSYQIEGGWNSDGKGPSIWDELTHKRPELIFDRSNGDVATNSYNLYQEDVRVLKDTKMNFYRFSISWSRIMPEGDTSNINEAGLQYYDNLINELLANGIEPMITMYHWDLPQALQEIGGMTNPLIIRYFEAYADVLFARYKDRVKLWSSFNEPTIICENGYGSSDRAPMVHSPGVGNYLCAHNLLIAHGKIYDLFHGKYQKAGNKMGIVLNCGYRFPLDSTDQLDVEAAERALQFSCGWFAHPIFSKIGGYPPIMVHSIAERSEAEGRSWSRLPYMRAEVRDSIRGKSDYFGLNYYTSNYATPAKWDPLSITSFTSDQYVELSFDDSWPVAKSTWLRSVPEGLRALLNWLKNEYDNPEIIVTENGWSDDGELNDVGRIEYLRGHLQAVLDARLIDNVNVTRHTTWSLVDNFEWMRGYSERFGIHYVDFNDPELTRVPKASATFLRSIIETKMIPDNLLDQISSRRYKDSESSELASHSSISMMSNTSSDSNNW